MDGDDAGYNARDRISSILAELFYIRAPRLSAGEKPDTLPEDEIRELFEF
jgi:hypothetical protein